MLISAVTMMELLSGATNKADLIRINTNVDKFGIVLVNDEITQIAMQLIQDYKLSHGLLLPVAFIAATALNTQQELFTYN